MPACLPVSLYVLTCCVECVSGVRVAVVPREACVSVSHDELASASCACGFVHVECGWMDVEWVERLPARNVKTATVSTGTIGTGNF